MKIETQIPKYGKKHTRESKILSNLPRLGNNFLLHNPGTQPKNTQQLGCNALNDINFYRL